MERHMLYILYIGQIMKILKCDMGYAEAVFNEIDIDFSECTDEEFERECLEAEKRVDVDFGFTAEMSTDELSDIYVGWIVDWGFSEDFPVEELVHEYGEDMSKFQKNWLFQFSEAFKASQAREDAAR